MHAPPHNSPVWIFANGLLCLGVLFCVMWFKANSFDSEWQTIGWFAALYAAIQAGFYRATKQP